MNDNETKIIYQVFTYEVEMFKRDYKTFGDAINKINNRPQDPDVCHNFNDLDDAQDYFNSLQSSSIRLNNMIEPYELVKVYELVETELLTDEFGDDYIVSQYSFDCSLGGDKSEY